MLTGEARMRESHVLAVVVAAGYGGVGNGDGDEGSVGGVG